MKYARLFLGAAIIAALSTNVWAQTENYPVTVVPQGKGPYTFPDGYRTDFGKIEPKLAEKFAADLFVIRGNEGIDTTHPEAAGGRIGVLFGPDGALVVDTQYPGVGDKMLQAIRSFTDAPIRILVNTHVHPDHVGSNATLAKQGALIIASENLRAEMLPNPNAPPRPAGSPPVASVDPASLPVVTYAFDPANPGKPAMTVHLDGDTVDIIPLGPGHTGGDSAIYFHKANAIFFGDVIRNFGGPFIDQGNGGSIQGAIATMDVLTKISDDNTILAPGHGALMHKKDLVPLRAMFVDLLAKTKTLVAADKSMTDVEKADLMAPYANSLPGYNQAAADRFADELYYEVRGLPPLVEGRRAMPRPPG
jgi:cyclase